MTAEQNKNNANYTWQILNPPQETADIFDAAPGVAIPASLTEMMNLSTGNADNEFFEVAYDIPDKGRIVEATVARVRNGISANYTEPYMRRRDPQCMVIADDLPTDKTRFRDRFGSDFAPLQEETHEWLKKQDLAAFAFNAGGAKWGIDALAIVPANAAFFAFGLALLQEFIPPDEIPEGFSPELIIYVAPPFRHTHFEGKQVVVHSRDDAHHLIYSYNLYPGPSAKKGVYGALITRAEREKWIVAHCSTVQVITPYDNVLTLMHEGASGGGKSEMLEAAHHGHDGRMLFGENTITGEQWYIQIPRMCDLAPVNDDMALCHPEIQDKHGYLHLVDAEKGWFVRVDHITKYGIQPGIEKLTVHPPEPLFFLNINATPKSTALLWEHTYDDDETPCPNPRVILPRKIIPGIQNEPVNVDVRSLGIRMPPCTHEHPSYGILGLFHIIPPALAWLWRLVAPRGYANPSIIDEGRMTSEGVGSYWPFATGRKVDQANLLLQQIIDTDQTLYILCPNQHIGAWKTSFMPQWIAREYLARRGHAPFKPEQLTNARCPLLGYAMKSLTVEGTPIPHEFLQVNLQPEVSNEAYDKGADILTDFFHSCIADFFAHEDLNPIGRDIIQCCMDHGTVADYENILQTSAAAIEK